MAVNQHPEVQHRYKNCIASDNSDDVHMVKWRRSEVRKKKTLEKNTLNKKKQTLKVHRQKTHQQKAHPSRSISWEASEEKGEKKTKEKDYFEYLVMGSSQNRNKLTQTLENYSVYLYKTLIYVTGVPHKLSTWQFTPHLPLSQPASYKNENNKSEQTMSRVKR